MKRPVIAIGSVALLIVAACAYSLPIVDRFLLDTEFDSVVWLQGDERQRGLMVHDLVKSKLLMEKTESEIRILLGQPDPFCSGNTWLGYGVDIGYRWPLSSLQYYLVVSIGKDERVYAVEIHRRHGSL